MRRSLNRYTIKLLWHPLWKTEALRRSRPLLLAPRLLKTFLKSRLKWGTASRWTRNRKLFFLRHQDSLALASSCSSPDLMQIDYSKGDQASHAPPHTVHPLPQRLQRYRQSFGVHSQQLMRQRFQHWTNAPVYISSPSSMIQLFRGTTSNRQLRGQLLNR